MRPEGGQGAEFLELGIPEKWIEPLFDLGYDSVDKLKEVENVLPECNEGKTSRAGCGQACGSE